MRSVLSFFSFFGRTRRAVYGAFCLATIPVFVIAVAAGTIAAVQTFGGAMFDGGTKVDADMLKLVDSLKVIPHQATVLVAAVAIATWILMCVAWFPLSARRLHDMGASGWITLAFVALIVLVSVFGYLLVCLVLSVWPGTNGANRYGRDPRRPDELAQVFADPRVPTPIR